MKNMIERVGAEVEVYGQVWNDANDRALKVVKELDKSVYIHPFDDPIVW